ncbi:VWA domain-containing protein [Corynebacterium pacaense]|uniref:VWA domain-containing protein n=1 Tax=Corynebacterium pacaense TaxID=1816684 RepID=UPI0009B9877B|nr:VWA domain-containing protein [Corynebacterium pacaense]
MSNSPDPGYPFSAIVGQDDVRLALILNAVSPRIGGVVIRGEKGTAKTTTVRSFARLPGDAPFVNLPLGATEDRVLGSIDVESVLRSGHSRYRPGLLAEADGGLLYVDEINLLTDHLVDALLDAAASGRVSIERDGVSHSSPARFILVGTMNPEEGELRPQLLDRFGLSVSVAASADPGERAEIIRRRLAFEGNPAAFSTGWHAADEEVSGRIAAASAALGSVRVPDEILNTIAELCTAVGVEGMRADLVITRTAAAHAAWCGHGEVTLADVEVAARLALPHRRTNDVEPPLDDAPPTDSDGEPEDNSTEERGEERGEENPDVPAQQDPPQTPSPESGGKRSTAPQGDPFAARLLTLDSPGVEGSSPGRRSAAYSHRGANIRAVSGGHGLNLIGTVRAAADRGARIVDSMVDLEPRDLRGSIRRGKEANLIVFVVDTSGSMAAAKRISSVTGAINSMLTDAYQRRDKVAVITASGSGARVVLPPTGSIELAHRRMKDIPVGGRTPLAQGLMEAADLLRREHLRDPGRRALLIALTDGQDTSTAGLPGVSVAAQRITQLGLSGNIVIDCERRGRIRLGLAARLAESLQGTCIELEDINAENLVGVISA